MTYEDEGQCKQARNEAQPPAITQNGVVTGVPGRRVVVNGVLDLRGVAPEEVAGIEELVANGVVVVDKENRAALGQVPTTVNGKILVAGPELRIMVQPDLEFTRPMMESMPAGQRLVMIGNIFFRPEVPASLVAEKLAEAHLVGVLIASESVYGALLGRAEVTGVSVVLEDAARQVVRCLGENELSPDYLSRLEDDTTYVNMGRTRVSEEVTEALLSRKIAAYHNLGETVAPATLLNLLKARCRTNLGSFSERPPD